MEFDGGVAIVTRSITEHTDGHVLALRDGCLIGHPAALGEVVPAREEREGFVQLSHEMIRLGSLLVEQRLIVYRHQTRTQPLGQVRP